MREDKEQEGLVTSVRQKRLKKWHYFVAGDLLLLIGCFHIEFPCTVTVKDADTGEPLSFDSGDTHSGPFHA